MTAKPGHTTRLDALLGRLRDGEAVARDELIDHACDRLKKLTRKMLGRYPKVRRWEETDDVFQNSAIRLHRALSDVKPESVRHFYALAGSQIRRELIDLARHHLGPAGHGVKHHTDLAGERNAVVDGHADGRPADPSAWSVFHEAVDRLPEKEREVVHLLWYEDVTQAEASEVMAVSVRTIKRLWQSARLILDAELVGDWPGA